MATENVHKTVASPSTPSSNEKTENVQRLFVAIPVPASARNELARAQLLLQAGAPPRALRWTNPEQIHLTLIFLGDVPEPRVEALNAAVLAACARHQPMTLRAEGIGFFPNERSPRVIWAGVTDRQGRLAPLQRSVAEAARPFAADPAGEDFVGHLTLGRFRAFRRAEMRAFMQTAANMREQPFGEWRAATVQIIRSELLPGGARHTLSAQFPLAEIN